MTTGTGGHAPREVPVPGEVFLRGPVRSDVRPPEGEHLEAVAPGVLQQLHGDPPPPEQRLVAGGERQPARHEVDVRPGGQLVSARPAQDQGVAAHRARRPGLEEGGTQQQCRGEAVHGGHPLPPEGTPPRSAHSPSTPGRLFASELS